ncbi:hypothetical protein QOT17_007788 [Balamuthia mandrillaris]
MATMQAGWGETADEIILKVFQHLTTGKDLYSNWNRVAATDQLWHSLYCLVQSSSSIRVAGESSYANLKSLILKIKHEKAKRAVLKAGRAELRLAFSTFSDFNWVNIAVVGVMSNDIRQLSHVFARRQTLEHQHLCDVPYHVRFEGDVLLRIFHNFGDFGSFQTPPADVFIMLYSTHDCYTLKKASHIWHRDIKEAHPNALVVLVGTEDNERNRNTFQRPACDEDAKEIANRFVFVLVQMGTVVC